MDKAMLLHVAKAKNGYWLCFKYVFLYVFDKKLSYNNQKAGQQLNSLRAGGWESPHSRTYLQTAF